LELQQKKSGKAGRVSLSFTNKFSLTKPFAEKYLKKLIGKRDIEDVLKRLDSLIMTQEEACMAAAQHVNTIDNRAGRIADNVLVVDNRVVGIDDMVGGVDEYTGSVDERLADVDDHAVDGAQYIFNQSSKNFQLLMRIDEEEAWAVI
jgi:hypothetical protein